MTPYLPIFIRQILDFTPLKNNIVCTYRVGRNIKAHIDAHNKAILGHKAEAGNENEEDRCRCRGGPSKCVLQGDCYKAKNVIYEAEVEAVDRRGEVVKIDGFDARQYHGQALDFKSRLYGHRTTFSDPKKILDKVVNGEVVGSRGIDEQIAEKEGKSELAKYVWKLKKMGLKFEIKWSIVKHARPYKKGSKYCDLCLSEKTVIALAGPSSLNKRKEILSKCKHMNDYKLDKVPLNPP